MKRKPKLPRNGHAFAPIMRKGGAHQKTNKAQRKAAKQAVQRAVAREENASGRDRDSFGIFLHQTLNVPA